MLDVIQKLHSDSRGHKRRKAVLHSPCPVVGFEKKIAPGKVFGPVLLKSWSTGEEIPCFPICIVAFPFGGKPTDYILVKKPSKFSMKELLHGILYPGNMPLHIPKSGNEFKHFL
jgi:hypothetical protein